VIPQTPGTVGALLRGTMDPDWLRWVKRLQAIAQDWLTYATDEYDAGRYEQVREVAAEILAARSTGELEDARGLLELERGPATPKVDVRAAVFEGDRILLVKEPDDGGWSLPEAGPTSARPRPRPPFERSSRSPATG
jgi:Hydrolase of X-linked nucleoside diphosphate N terminal